MKRDILAEKFRGTNKNFFKNETMNHKISTNNPKTGNTGYIYGYSKYTIPDHFIIQYNEIWDMELKKLDSSHWSVLTVTPLLNKTAVTWFQKIWDRTRIDQLIVEGHLKRSTIRLFKEVSDDLHLMETL